MLRCPVVLLPPQRCKSTACLLCLVLPATTAVTRGGICNAGLKAIQLCQCLHEGVARQERKCWATCRTTGRSLSHARMPTLQMSRLQTHSHLRETPKASLFVCPFHVLPQSERKRRQPVCSTVARMGRQGSR